MKHRVTGFAVSAFFVTCLFLTGCSYTILPGDLPASPVNQGTPLSGSTVLIVNAEKNAADSPVTVDGKTSSDIRTNRRAWSNKMVEYLAGSLARQGCRVQSTAKLVVSISLPDIIFKDDVASTQFTVKMLAAASTGWSKTYEGTAQTKRVSSPGEADHLITLAFAETARMILSDSEFQNQLLQK
jgi:hypothetical protein